MTAAKVIEEIMHLPREEQSLVLEFAFELARKRQLSRKALSALAQRMVDSDPHYFAQISASDFGWAACPPPVALNVFQLVATACPTENIVGGRWWWARPYRAGRCRVDAD